MHLLHRICAGLDVHKKTVVACVRRLTADDEVFQETLSFGTTTRELLSLADWLAAQGVTHVAMESTGVYWKPIFHILEDHFAVLLVNAQHLKRVEGRKTDIKDAEWIAELLQFGLLSPSFIPPPQIRELRDLTRQRTVLTRDKVRVANRIQKVLEDGNIKLASVASDPLGVSGRAMLRAMIAGEEDPEVLAQLARQRLRRKIPELKEALLGHVTEHHRFLLSRLLEQLERIEELIEQFNDRIGLMLAPLVAAARRLQTIPGIGMTAAEVILAEIGPDMARFPSAGHLAGWAGLRPGTHQTAQKRRPVRTTQGDQWLRTVLVQAAWAATHTPGTVFAVVYSRWIKRMGKKKALVAVAHKLVRVIYRLLKDGVDYQESVAPQPAL
jgi:transposase